MTPAEGAAVAGVERHRAGEVTFADAERPHPDEDDDQQAGQFDAGQDDVDLHGLADAAEVDGRNDQHERDPEQCDADPGLQVDLECFGEVRGEGTGRGRRRGDARAHHRERDHEREELDPERLVRVQRGTRRLRILRDEFEVAERRDERDRERHQERQPHDAADVVGDLTGEGVDAGAEDVADDEQQQEPWPHHAFERRFLRRI